MSPQVTRRRFIEIGSLSGLGLLLAPLALSRASTREASSAFAKAFAAPARQYQPKFRWWWPHGLVSNEQIRKEIDAMADAGFGGAEIADVHHSTRKELEPHSHGWGTDPWRQAVHAALDQAQKRGMNIDHSIGPSWPAASSKVDPNHPASAKELATGRAFLAEGESFSGSAPKPDRPARDHTHQQELLALQAAQLAPEATRDDKEISLLQDSVIDLLPLLENGSLSWTPPAKGNWIIISYWMRGSRQRPEGGPHGEPKFYVVDHFSQAGTQAIFDLWEEKVLTPEIRSLIAQVGGALFEDSIEIETDEKIWTPHFLEEFKNRRGYSLLPYLPLALQHDEDHIFEYKEFDAGHLRHDWWLTLSEMFQEHHFEAIREWANKLGLGFRGQPYGLRTDAVLAAATLDISEGESLGFKNLDDYRSLAGGRDMGGRKVLSNEAAAYPGAAYAVTWKRVLKTLNPQFAAGVNQTVLHGFAYAEAPGAKWPGFAAFTPYGGKQGYSEAWGPRQPSWKHITDISGYFSRVHMLMQQGQHQVDIAFLRQKGYAGSGFGAPWFSKQGVPTGWTHNFVSPATLELPSATVRNGRLAPDGPAYKALVFEGDAFNKRKPSLPLSPAEKLLKLARAGLPILVVGDWSQATASGVSSAEETAEIQITVDQLLAEPTVHNVPTRESIPVGIEKMGIQRDVTHDKSSLVHAQRKTNEARVFYFCNQDDSKATHRDVTIRSVSAKERVYRFDLWTGKITEDTSARYDSGNAIVPIGLQPGSSTAIAIAPKNWIQTTKRSPHIDAPPTKEIEIEKWKLVITEWLPGASQSETLYRKHERHLNSLTSWTDIPDLENASGIGSYIGEFTLDRKAAKSMSIRLNLKGSFNTHRIRINDNWLPPIDPLEFEVPISEYIRRGKNRIEIETTSTLLNRLIEYNPPVYGHAKPQKYGLDGSAKIVW